MTHIGFAGNGTFCSELTISSMNKKNLNLITPLIKVKEGSTLRCRRSDIAIDCRTGRERLL